MPCNNHSFSSPQIVTKVLVVAGHEVLLSQLSQNRTAPVIREFLLKSIPVYSGTGTSHLPEGDECYAQGYRHGGRLMPWRVGVWDAAPFPAYIPNLEYIYDKE